MTIWSLVTHLVIYELQFKTQSKKQAVPSHLSIGKDAKALNIYDFLDMWELDLQIIA